MWAELAGTFSRNWTSWEPARPQKGMAPLRGLRLSARSLTGHKVAIS